MRVVAWTFFVKITFVENNNLLYYLPFYVTVHFVIFVIILSGAS